MLLHAPRSLLLRNRLPRWKKFLSRLLLSIRERRCAKPQQQPLEWDQYRKLLDLYNRKPSLMPKQYVLFDSSIPSSTQTNSSDSPLLLAPVRVQPLGESDEVNRE